jgi:hypothetical protein
VLDRQDLRTAVIALVVVLTAGATPAIAHGVTHALFAHRAGNAENATVANNAKKLGKRLPSAYLLTGQRAAGVRSVEGLGNATCASGSSRTAVLMTGADDGLATVELGCVVPDEGEQIGDDTRDKARTVVDNCIENENSHVSSVMPAGDDDWLVLTFPPGVVSGHLTLHKLAGAGSPRMDVYLDGTQVESGVEISSETGGDAEHAWEVRVFAAAPVAYEIGIVCNHVP